MKSPWCQAPGNVIKYDFRYALSPSGPQNFTGIQGNGRVQTKSPASPVPEMSLPEGSQASTFMPRPRHWISPV